MRLVLALALVAAAPAGGQPADRFPHNDVTRQLKSPTGNIEASIRALQSTLTELQQLQLQTKQAHWNVSGTLFYPLHLLLQEHYEGLSKYADECAERLLAIGASSDGRATTIIRTSLIPEYPGGFTDDAAVIKWFSAVYLTADRVTQQGIKATNDSDPTTSNLLQEIDHALAKYQWQMRAHLQETATDANRGADIGAPAAPAPPPAGPAGFAKP
ncbi:MAG: DNA starvation/stationary phase protection protein [Sphingomonadaceae bacterium]|nr:DNA starvation/stationary phase protection protein [Sphingomonadaceae bacterium]